MKSGRDKRLNDNNNFLQEWDYKYNSLVVWYVEEEEPKLPDP